MKILGKSRHLCAGLLAIALIVTGCSGGASSSSGDSAGKSSGPAPSQSAPTNLNVGLNADIGDISPFGSVSTGRTYTKYTIYEYLLQYSEFGQTVDTMIHQVAKDVSVVDDKTSRVQIYDYVQDAAGNPITSADILFCYNKMLESKNLPKLNTYIEKIDIVDDYTLDFHFTTTKVGAMEYVFCQVPIVSQKAFEASENGMSTKPVSTAPYQVTNMVAGSSMALEKNANYWQKDESLRTYLAAQKYDTISMSVITEASQMTIALQSGTIDAATVVGGKELANFVDATGKAVSGYSAKQQVGGVVYSLLFNTSANSPFENQALRQAICYAVDSEAVLQGASNGQGVLTHTASSPIAGDYNKKWDSEEYYDFDIDTAKEKMSEGGYPDGNLDVRLMVENTAEYNKMAEVIQAYLMQIGVNTQILSYDAALFNTYKTESDQWDIRLTAIGTSDFVVGAYELEVGTGIASKYLVDSKLDELLNTATQVSSHTAENVDALHSYIKEQAYAYGLYATASTSVSRDTVEIVRHPWGQLIAGACKPAE